VDEQVRRLTSELRAETPGAVAHYITPVSLVTVSRENLAKVGAIATIGGAIVTLHGVTNRRWQRAHTLFAFLALAVAVISFTQRALHANE
jgi:hypothetical protein